MQQKNKINELLYSFVKAVNSIIFLTYQYLFINNIKAKKLLKDVLICRLYWKKSR